MLFKKGILLFLVLLFFSGCEGKNTQQIITEDEMNKIYVKKGSYMKKRLKPEIIKTDKAILAITGVNIKNTLGALNGKGEYSLASFDKEGNIDLKVILPGHPENKSLDLYSDDENNIMWVMRGRGIYFIDINTKTTVHVTASNDGNGKVYTVFTVDPVEKMMGIVYTNCPGCSTDMLLYDIKQQKEINTLYVGSGRIFPYYEKYLLTCFYNKEDQKKTVEWKYHDFFAKNPEDLYTDKLTENLTKTQMDTWMRSKIIHLKKRMLLCYTLINYDLKYFSVRWDEKREDIKIEPILLQVPKNKMLDVSFSFSPDGNWVKSLALPDDLSETPPELLIFNTGDAYPQGLSMPILCGYTKRNGYGAFMDHDTWGPCYVELDSDFPDKIFVFKLNQGLKLLAEQALEGPGK